MSNKISLSTIGHTASLFLAISFILCVGFGLVFPGFAMYKAWQALLPEFTWLTPGTFFLGLVESYAYGWYVALLWVPLYNLFARRAVGSSGMGGAGV